ncbi:MAG: YggT family protein [Gaiellaceae bacterium]|jgi:YggT family protein
MGTEASLAMLCSVIAKVMAFVNVSVIVYSLIIFLYILSSWIPLPYNRNVNRLRRFLFDVCDPYLRLFRRLLPPFGAFDLSPILAVVTLAAVGYAINAILAQFG